jgi:quercetin dioxygenase-like cupin family protein
MEKQVITLLTSSAYIVGVWTGASGIELEQHRAQSAQVIYSLAGGI